MINSEGCLPKFWTWVDPQSERKTTPLPRAMDNSGQTWIETCDNNIYNCLDPRALFSFIEPLCQLSSTHPHQFSLWHVIAFHSFRKYNQPFYTFVNIEKTGQKKYLWLQWHWWSRKIGGRGCMCQAFHAKHMLFYNCMGGWGYITLCIRTIEELVNWTEADLVCIKIQIHGIPK